MTPELFSGPMCTHVNEHPHTYVHPHIHIENTMILSKFNQVKSPLCLALQNLSYYLQPSCLLLPTSSPQFPCFLAFCEYVNHDLPQSPSAAFPSLCKVPHLPLAVTFPPDIRDFFPHLLWVLFKGLFPSNFFCDSPNLAE